MPTSLGELSRSKNRGIRNTDSHPPIDGATFEGVDVAHFPCPRAVYKHAKRVQNKLYRCRVRRSSDKIEVPAAPIDRRTLIADVALRLLGQRGARGLTHRAVDREAGLPAGSTSYYCRRRHDLLALAFRRHAELDHQEIAAQASRHSGKALSLQVVADVMATQVERWSRLKYPYQLTARFEIVLAASRDPSLAAVTAESRKRFVATLDGALRVLKLPDPANVAAALIAFTEGVLLDQARAGKPVLGARPLRKTLLAILQSSEKVN
jgi:DNA-binding transcriptional regulator YbjK